MTPRPRHLAALLICLVGACQTVPPTASPIVSGAPRPSGSPIAAVPTPAPTQAIGALLDGVPMTLDAQPVFVGDRLRAEIKARTVGTAFYAGGWFRDAQRSPGFCVFHPPPPVFDLCDFGFSLYDGRTGYWDITLSLGRPPHTVIDESLPFAADRAVVLRVHTNDPTCTPDVAGYPSCVHIPVVEGVAWLGAIETEAPVPTAGATPPADGLPRQEAIALARGEVVGSSQLVCARLLVWSDVEGALHTTKGGYNDPWVWYAAFKRSPVDWKEVVLQYRTGRLLSSSTSHGPGAGPGHC